VRGIERAEKERRRHGRLGREDWRVGWRSRRGRWKRRREFGGSTKIDGPENMKLKIPRRQRQHRPHRVNRCTSTFSSLLFWRQAGF